MRSSTAEKELVLIFKGDKLAKALDKKRSSLRFVQIIFVEFESRKGHHEVA